MDGAPHDRDEAEKVVEGLQKDFTIVGRHRVHAWYAWAIVGIVFGMALGIVYVANRGGQFDASQANTLLPGYTGEEPSDHRIECSDLAELGSPEYGAYRVALCTGSVGNFNAGGVVKRWGGGDPEPGHEVTFSQSWPHFHAISISKGWPSDHTVYHSQQWPWDHYYEQSRRWPPDHNAPVSTFRAHKYDGHTWPDGHDVAFSDSWPEDHSNDTSSQWPANHFVETSQDPN